MIKTVSQAIDDMAVSLGASPSAEIPTVAQALENVYTALGGTRTDLDTLVVSEVIDLVAPLIQGGGGGGVAFPTFTVPKDPSDYSAYSCDMTYAEVKSVWETEKDTSDNIICKLIEGLNEYWFSPCSVMTDIEDLPVTEGFFVSIGYLYGSDGNFYEYSPK